MSDKDTGGPAFPTNQENYASKNWCSDGMTLRDYFAAKAMQAEYHLLEPLDQLEGCAKGAYRMADAMLAERNKK